jgi:hypothetical protein
MAKYTQLKNEKYHREQSNTLEIWNYIRYSNMKDTINISAVMELHIKP